MLLSLRSSPRLTSWNLVLFLARVVGRRSAELRTRRSKTRGRMIDDTKLRRVVVAKPIATLWSGVDWAPDEEVVIKEMIEPTKARTIEESRTPTTNITAGFAMFIASESKVKLPLLCALS
jgi:hypothetical protein